MSWWPLGLGRLTWILRRETAVFASEHRATRVTTSTSPCKAKANGNYINSILALREALDAGCEEALLLDNEGYVAEGSGENVFVVRDGKIYTPELTSCLEEERVSIFRIAADLGYEIKERRITRDEFYVADEAFFTGTAAEVVPIRELTADLSDQVRAAR